MTAENLEQTNTFQHIYLSVQTKIDTSTLNKQTQALPSAGAAAAVSADLFPSAKNLSCKTNFTLAIDFFTLRT
jgi:hypothetical protein